MTNDYSHRSNQSTKKTLDGKEINMAEQDKSISYLPAIKIKPRIPSRLKGRFFQKTKNCYDELLYSMEGSGLKHFWSL